MRYRQVAPLDPTSVKPSTLNLICYHHFPHTHFPLSSPPHVLCPAISRKVVSHRLTNKCGIKPNERSIILKTSTHLKSTNYEIFTYFSHFSHISHPSTFSTFSTFSNLSTTSQKIIAIFVLATEHSELASGSLAFCRPQAGARCPLGQNYPPHL